MVPREDCLGSMEIGVVFFCWTGIGLIFGGPLDEYDIVLFSEKERMNE